MAALTHIVISASDPAGTPEHTGQHHLNTTTNALFVAKGTTGVGDWVNMSDVGARTKGDQGAPIVMHFENNALDIHAMINRRDFIPMVVNETYEPTVTVSREVYDTAIIETFSIETNTGVAPSNAEFAVPGGSPATSDIFKVN